MSNLMTSEAGKNNKNPDVGFGVVGTKTDNNVSPAAVFWANSPLAVVDIKPIAQIPLRGYWIKQAVSKLRSLCAKTVSAICLTPEYMDRTTGIRSTRRSPQ